MIKYLKRLYFNYSLANDIIYLAILLIYMHILICHLINEKIYRV